MADLNCDVLVVGAGNAALCAALSARAAGASVMVLERAPEDERGGNSRFTEGSMRFAFNGREDILKVVPDLTDDEKAITEFGSYPEDQFFDDIARVTDYRSDPDLAELLVKRSYETVMWLRSMGIRYMPKYGKQAYKVNGRFTFSGGVVLEVWGGGPGLIEALYKLARDRGVTIHFNARALDLIHDDSGVHGARVRRIRFPAAVESWIPACAGMPSAVPLQLSRAEGQPFAWKRATTPPQDASSSNALLGGCR